MTARRGAVMLLLAALGLYLWVVQPYRERTAAVTAALTRTANDRTRLRVDLARADRLESDRARVVAALRKPTADALRPSAIRSRILEEVAGFPVSGVRLTVAASRPGEPTSVHVEGQGRFLDLVALSTRLAHPDLGLALERVAFSPSSGSQPGAQLVIDASTLGGPR
jgi:hypothetical protein